MNKTKDKVIVFKSEYVGRGDDTLGFEITITLLDALIERDDRPKAMIFLNTSVMLLVEGSPTFPRLKTLEKKGVQILAGKLCLNNLCISDTIVGKPSSMDEILDLLLHNDVITL